MPPAKKPAGQDTVGGKPVTDAPARSTSRKERGRQIAEERLYHTGADGITVLVAAKGQPIPDWYAKAAEKSTGTTTRTRANTPARRGPDETA